MVPEVQKPSQEPCIAFYPKRRIRNLLREKHFHGVSSGSRHEYLLKLRYGKVRYENFSPTSDAEVRDLLARAAQWQATTVPAV